MKLRGPSTSTVDTGRIGVTVFLDRCKDQPRPFAPRQRLHAVGALGHLHHLAGQRGGDRQLPLQVLAVGDDDGFIGGLIGGGSLEPPKIPEPSLAAVLDGHRSLGAPGSPFHGTYRQINLHGTAALLAWQQIPEAMQELFDNVAAMRAEADAGRLAARVATLFMDFLRIHPFLNGNRRTAMAFATALCERQGFVLDWSSLSRSELYYAVRCAAAGHSRVLEAALRSRLKRH
ncbi:hypothetical protein EXH46_21510 [Pelomonas puraquae]|nr:hypothetical protein [Roseateles puraquae]